MRRLYIIPIIHTYVELGSIAQELKKRFIKEKGVTEWKKHQSQIKQFWDMLERKLRSSNFDYKKVKIYQDGFPIGMNSDEMIKQLVEQGSRNYIIIQSLIKKGAQLLETENPSLLCEELKRLKSEKDQSKINAEKLLHERDSFIARQIDKTLPEEAPGILFIGATHNVAPYLPSDIQIVTIKI